MRQRAYYAWLTVGAGVGLVASFLEMLEYLQLQKNPHAALSCNLNSAFSCTNVLNAWQSSVFGFPNVLLCIMFFTIMLSFGIAGLTGSSLARKLRLSLHGIALFFLGFGLWFLQQSTYRIGALCILCLFCFAGLMAINGSWLRLNAADLPFGKKLQAGFAKGTDIFAWLVLALLLALAMIIRFA